MPANLGSRFVPRHDRDAGGPADLLAAKAAVRDRVWDAMAVNGINRFPGPVNRIPNFVGAERAAQLLAETDEWQAAAHGEVESRLAATSGTRPRAEGRQARLHGRTAAGRGGSVLRPRPRSARRPAGTRGIDQDAARSARTVDFDAMTPVDLVVTGCVAVGEDGARLGKGGGFSDLEFALAAAAGLVDDDTVVVTTVHDVQVQPAGRSRWSRTTSAST